MRSGVFGVCLAVFVPLGCGAFEPKPTPEFQIQIRVEGDPGRPLPGAKVLYEDTKIGETDKDGVSTLSLTGDEGQSYSLDVSCPGGYTSPGKPLVVTLRRVVESSKLPSYSAQCPPSRRKLVVAVRADKAPGMPLLYLAKEVARTDAAGAAHFVLELAPGQRGKVTLDTSTNVRLEPSSPSHVFEVKDRDEMVLFEPKFTEKPRWRGGGVKKPSGPTRIP